MESFNQIVLWLRLHSIIFMVAVFTLIVIAAYRPANRARFERDGAIPLRDD